MFSAVCGTVLADKTEFTRSVRRIKDLFIQRDFLAIFTNPKNLFVYLARWVPPRALCYFNLFGQNPVLKKMHLLNVRWTCLGAGPGSELVALSAIAVLNTHCSRVGGTAAAEGEHCQFLDVFLHDIGEFGPGVSQLVGMTEQRWGFGSHRVRTQFMQGDLLAEAMAPELEEALATSHVATLLFTVNELFQQDTDATLAALKGLAKRMHSNAILVIADSVSDMSTLKVFGGKEFRIPTVLDNVFRGLTKVCSEDSVWYRLPKDIEYQCELQNVHYFLRCYQKPETTLPQATDQAV